MGSGTGHLPMGSGTVHLPRRQRECSISVHLRFVYDVRPRLVMPPPRGH